MPLFSAKQRLFSVGSMGPRKHRHCHVDELQIAGLPPAGGSRRRHSGFVPSRYMLLQSDGKIRRGRSKMKVNTRTALEGEETPNQFRPTIEILPSPMSLAM